MPNINCNIIKDLLPSYLDDICSKESARIIEEHFKECENCKKLYEQTKLEILHTNSSTTKEIDYFKKIRTTVSHKNAVIYVVIALLFTVEIYSNLLDPYGFGNAISMYINYLFPILTAGMLFVILPDYAEHPVPKQLKFTVLGIEFLIMTYILGILLFVGINLLNGTLPFGMEAAKIGPFLNVQILTSAYGFILVFALTLILSTRKRAICPALHFVPLGGISLMFEYERLLHVLDGQVSLSMFVKPYIIFACEVIVLVGIYMFVNRKK